MAGSHSKPSNTVMSETPETDLEESLQTQRYGCRMVKSTFARKLELRHRALLRSLSELEYLSRDKRTTRQALRDGLGAMLHSANVQALAPLGRE
jgi:hypothetical protein